MKRVLAILPLILLLCLPGAALAANPKPTDTPTPTLDPSITETASPTPDPLATPTPTGPTATPWIVIMVTATPELKPIPPSLFILDLDKKIKKGQAGAVTHLAMINADLPPEIDQTVGVFMAWLVGRELYYQQMTGKYCQMLPSHLAAIPADGIHEYPDGWYTHPTDQQYSWDDLDAIQFEPLPFAITVDTYHGPEGPGFTACFLIVLSGSPYQRCVNYGPEALRNRDWQPVIEVGL